MSMSFDEIMQSYVNLEYHQLVAIAQKSIISIKPICEAIDPDNNGMTMLTAILLSAVSADGVLTAREQQFFRDVLGFTDELINSFAALHTGEEAELVDKFVDTCGDDVKADTIALVLAFAACDETIKREETAFIAKLIE